MSRNTFLGADYGRVVMKHEAIASSLGAFIAS